MSTSSATFDHLVAGQHGMLTTQQCQRLGVTRPRLCELVRQGTLVHAGRGLYALTTMVDPTPEGWHLQLSYGAQLLYPDAVLSGTSALLAHGIPVWGSDLKRPSIRRPVDRSRGMSAFWVRPSDGSSVATPWGAAQPVARALIEHTIDRGIEQGMVSMDAALNADAVSMDELEAESSRVAHWPRASRVRSALSFCDARHESVGESRCAIALALCGIRVVPQVTIRDGRRQFVARVDFLVEGTTVIIEFDGRVKYKEGDPSVLWDEKNREDRLRALGYIVIRITWADLATPGAVSAKVRGALRAA